MQPLYTYSPLNKPRIGNILSPSLLSSGILIGSIFLAYLTISITPSQTEPSVPAQQTAVFVGVGLVLSVIFDFRRGWRNLFRIDLLCLTSLYGLTLIEFLFPQPNFNQTADLQETLLAIQAVLLGFAGIVIGRHLSSHKPITVGWLQFKETSSSSLLKLYWMSAFLGSFWMLLSVNFNLVTFINTSMGARFSQPWSRGRFGGATALLSELRLFLLLVPALFGIMLARRKTIPKHWMFLASLVFALTIFQGFCSGTRSILVMYVAAFLAGYLLNLPRNTLMNTFVPILGGVLLIYVCSYHMLQFRTIGLAAYLNGYRAVFLSDTFFVDYNLRSLGQILTAMPENHGFLGWEVFSWALIRPIPRILFPLKPESLSVSIEEIVGAQGWTVATTYIGESYMAGGWIAIAIVSVLIGVLAAFWNRMSIQTYSSYTMLVYASGFAAAAITMRSMFETTTALLPVVALLLYPRFIDRSLRA